jgi:hypothetical protein
MPLGYDFWIHRDLMDETITIIKDPPPGRMVFVNI